MSILQQNNVMREKNGNEWIKGHQNIINIILLDPLNWFYLALLKTHNNQRFVTYNHGTTVTKWTLLPNHSIHIQNDSKTPTLRMIKFPSSFHTLNISPPHHVSTTCWAKPLVNTIMMWYNTTKQYTSVARLNVQQYWSTFVRV